MIDGQQGISHDRILMRAKDYIQILTTVGALMWGGVKLIVTLNEMNIQLQQIPILQQQISSLQQLVVNAPAQHERRRRSQHEDQ